MHDTNPVKDIVISPNFTEWKFCRKAQFPHSFYTRKLGETPIFFAVKSFCESRKTFRIWETEKLRQQWFGLGDQISLYFGFPSFLLFSLTVLYFCCCWIFIICNFSSMILFTLVLLATFISCFISFNRYSKVKEHRTKWVIIMLFLNVYNCWMEYKTRFELGLLHCSNWKLTWPRKKFAFWVLV